MQRFGVNRIPKIIIPFILSNIIFVFIDIIKGRKFYTFDLFMYILGIKLIDSNKQYRILTMFSCITFYIIILIIIGKEGHWYNSAYSFLLGIIVSEYKEHIFKIIKQNYMIFISINSILFLVIFLLNIIKEGVFLQMIESVLFICILMKIEINNKIINFLGTISYEIYLVHRIFIDGVNKENKYIYLWVWLKIMRIDIQYIVN